MHSLPMAMLSVSSFFLAPFLLPRFRFRLHGIVCPLNWFFLVYCLQLVITPCVVIWAGPAYDVMPSVPSDFSLNFALALYTLGYWSFAIAVHTFRKEAPVFALATTAGAQSAWFPPMRLVVLYVVLGSIGVAAFFGNPTLLIQYFIDPHMYTLNADDGGESASLATAASVFLRAFLPFSVIMLWCRGIAQRPKTTSLFSKLRSPFLLLLIAITAPLYSYERSAIVVPMIAIAAVMAKRKARGTLLRLGVVVALAVIFVAIITSFRADPAVEAGIARGQTPMEQFQLYAAAPQLLGFLVEKSHYGTDPHFGSITVSSILAPWPIIGKLFRNSFGAAVFGDLLNRRDVPAPFTGELFLDFNILGVIIGFFAVGWLVAKLQNLYDSATAPLKVYVLQFAAVWLSYTVMSSINVVSLAAFYLSWPIYVFLIYLHIKQRREISHGGLRALKQRKLVSE